MELTPLRVDHFALPAFDAAETFQFYTEVMGAALVNALSGDDWGGKPWLMMIFSFGDGRQLALVALRGLERPASDGLPQDTRHFGFSVGSEEALAKWKHRLRSYHVNFREEDHGSQRSVYFEDPNGVTLEITTPDSETASAPNRTASDIVKRWIEDNSL